jgi:Domain of unknown function (DUF4956)
MNKTLLNCFFFLLLLTPFSKVMAQNNNAPTPVITEERRMKEAEKRALEAEEQKIDRQQEQHTFFSFNIDRFDLSFFLRLVINLLSMLVLIRAIYYPVYKRSDQLFTFYMFNLAIFIITFVLNTGAKDKAGGFSMGAAFGLFAVFSLLRYRTEDISARDMTYLFIVIALGLISSVNKGTILEILLINSVILLAAWMLDGNILMKTEFVKTVQYDNIEMIKPENHAALIEDMKKRTGLNVHKISIGRVDFLKDTATVKVYYYESKAPQQ